MGLFANLRSAGTIAAASAFISKHLRAQVVAGRFRGDPGKSGEAMVLALWSSLPELASGAAKPKAVLLAAGALAKAVREADLKGNQELGNVLHSALQMLWLADMRTLVDIERIAGIDAALFELAGAVMEKN